MVSVGNLYLVATYYKWKSEISTKGPSTFRNDKLE